MPYFLNMHLLTFIFNPTLNSFPDRLLLDGVSRILMRCILRLRAEVYGRGLPLIRRREWRDEHYSLDDVAIVGFGISQHFGVRTPAKHEVIEYGEYEQVSDKSEERPCHTVGHAAVEGAEQQTQESGAETE